MKVQDGVTGDLEDVTPQQLAERVKASVGALRGALDEALDFERKLRAGTLAPGDSFQDHTSPLEHGYDRTGPSETAVVDF